MGMMGDLSKSLLIDMSMPVRTEKDHWYRFVLFALVCT